MRRVQTLLQRLPVLTLFLLAGCSTQLQAVQLFRTPVALETRAQDEAKSSIELER